MPLPSSIGSYPPSLRRLPPVVAVVAAFLLLIVGPLWLVPAAHAIAPGDVSIVMTTSPTFVSDSNNCSGGDGPHAAYVGFKVTNTSGGTLTNLQVSLGDFDTVAGQHFGQLRAGIG